MTAQAVLSDFEFLPSACLASEFISEYRDRLQALHRENPANEPASGIAQKIPDEVFAA